MFKIFSFLFLFLSLSYAQQGEIYPIIKIYNVGQGNFVTVQYNEKIFVFDCGSSSYSAEWQYFDDSFNSASSLKDRTRKHSETLSCDEIAFHDEKGSPSKIKRFSDEGFSSPNQGKRIYQNKTPQQTTPKSRKKLDHRANKFQEFIRKVREDWGGNRIEIEATFISHPDIDHYNWLTYILSEDDKVNHLYLSGKIKHYSNLDTIILKSTLEKEGILHCSYYKNGTFCGKDRKLEDIIETCSKSPLKNREYGCQNNSNYIYQDSRFKIEVLAQNPLNFSLDNGFISNNAHNDNYDSTIYRVIFGKSSILIPGDATSIVFNNLIGSQANDSKQAYLNSTIFLASHHGSTQEGNNSAGVVKSISPHYIIVSHGLKHDHPV